MLMIALIAVAVVLLFVLAALADRLLKARKRARGLRQAAERLSAAAAGAEAKEQQRLASQQASAELTSVMPTIHKRDTRRV
jgi:hypothetical protein